MKKSGKRSTQAVHTSAEHAVVGLNNIVQKNNYKQLKLLTVTCSESLK